VIGFMQLIAILVVKTNRKSETFHRRNHSVSAVTVVMGWCWGAVQLG
jgi:hypothetical protein